MSTSAKRVEELSPEKRALLMARLAKKRAEELSREAIPPRADQGAYPLSYGQQRLWFLDQLEPDSPLYSIPAALRLRGAVDVAALEQSLAVIMARHEVLRVRFVTERGHPVQQVAPAPEVAAPLALVDLSHLDPAAAEAEALRLATAEAQRPFDLGQGPLIRASLLRLGAADHVLLLTMHHSVADGWSVAVLTQELAALYAANRAGQPAPLAPLPIQYADYAAWQRARLQGPLVAEQLAYWREQLGVSPAPLELPTDRPRPAVQGFAGAHYSFALPGAAVAALRELSRQEDATLFMALLALYEALLARYSGQEDFCVGAPVASRTRPELEPLIGFFVNTLVLRADLAGAPSFRELLRRVRTTTLAGMAHQDVPFEMLVETLHVGRDLSRTPLFQVMFTLQQMPTRQVSLPGVELEVLDVETGTAKFDLLLLITEDSDGLQASFEYSTDLFDQATIARMAGHFTTLLLGAVADADQPVASLPLLSPAEREQVLFTWNDTATDYPREATIAQLFEEQAARRPEAPAVLFRDQALSYGELNARANQLAHLLRRQGVGPEVLVGLALERSLDLIVGALAALKAGGAYLPLDPNYPAERLRFMLEDARPLVVLTAGGQAEERWAGLTGARAIRLDADWPQIAGEPATNPERAAQAESLAYVMYTSGSTGQPKGIAITQRNVVRLVKGTNYATLDESVVFLQFGAVAFDASTLEIWGPLLNGGRLVLFPDTVPDLDSLGRAIRTYGVTTMFLTSGLFHQMVEYRLEDLAGLRELMAGGDVVSPVHAQRVLRELAGCRLSNAYGPTENTTFSTFYPVPDVEAIGAALPIGRPIASSTAYILDRDLQPVPVGVPGELCVGGDGVARGYLNRPELTAEKFVELDLGTAPGGGDVGALARRVRLYRTGDLARFRPDGNIEFLGRIDQQVKIRGFRIELGEIEAVLKQHPAVREVAVVARQDQPGVKKLVAYVVPSEEGRREADAGSPQPAGPGRQSAVASELREFLKARLPEFMVPAAFVELAELPLTANGKVDRRALPAPDQARDAGDAAYVAPRSAVEQFLAGIWQEVLGIERISVHDNFFELGGDSLQAAVLTNRIQEDLQVTAHVRALFMAPNIADLARYVEEYYPDAARRLGEEASGPVVAPSAIISGGAGAGQIDEARVSQIRAIIPPLQPRPAGLVSAAKNPPAVFVLSPPRSGSTLLRTMLAGHPDLFAPPELDLLSFNTLAERRAAFSGEHSFWLEGPIRALMELLGVDAAQAAEIMAGHEEAGMTVKEFYGLVQGWLGGRRLTDKTPTYPLDPAVLRRMEEDFDQPVYIHLVRHPHASVYSFMEAKLDHIFFRHRHPFAPRELAELVWIICHEHILGFLRDIPAERQVRISFEDLVGQPEEAMRQLCAFLGIPFEESMLKPYEGRRMTDGIRPGAQMVGDFKFYLRKDIDPRAATRWQQFHAEEFLSPISWRIAGELGYEMPVPAEPAAPARVGLPPLVPVSRSQELPLSFAQQRLWFLDQLDPGSPLYNIPAAIRLQGSLDPGVLERSVNMIVARHEVLRTTFATRDGQALQVIGPPSTTVALGQLDLSSLPAEERMAEAARMGAEEARRPFDLAVGPLLRATLLRLGSDDHILLLTMHHIVADGWSTGVIAREMGVIYDALVQGRPDPLPPLTVQYADVAAWQRAGMASAAMAEQLAYWTRTLGGPDGHSLPAPLELPTDRPRPAVPSYNGRRLLFRWSPELSAQVRSFCRREETTLFMTLLAAFKALLLRYSGQEDVSVGTPVASRTRKEIEPLIGFFVNTLVLRTDLSGAPSFRTLLERVRATAVEAYANQDVPFEMLVDALQPQRHLNQTPLFQVMFTVQQATFQALKLPSLTISSLEADSQTAKFDLTVSVVDRADGLWGSIEYSTDLFDHATIERMAGHYQTLVAAAVAHPEQPVARLPLLTRAEEHQILVEWNATAAPYPAERTVHELFAEQALRTPEAVAVAYGADRYTFRALDTRANQLAHHLQQLGVAPDTLVGVCLERSVDLIVAILATLKAGGAYLPLDPSYPAERLQLMVDDARPLVLLTQQHLAQGGFWTTNTSAPPVVALDADWGTISAQPATAPRSTAGPGNLAYVIYTSGSTGTPKGAMIEHRQALNLAAALKGRIYDRLPGEQLRVSLNAPPSFDASVQQIVMLIYGHTLEIVPQDVRLDGAELLAFVRERRLDLLDCVPSQLKLLLDAGLLDGKGWTPRLVLPGGEAIDDATWRVLAAAPSTDFFNVYGPTECTVDSTTISAREAPERATIGRPLANVQVYVLDRNLQPVPVGVPGELYIGGAGVGRGYLSRPELTAERFVEIGVSESRVYRTGDLVRWCADGTIAFLGRLDHQVKLRGFRIELGEIEAALASHPAVRESVVLVREDVPGVRRLVAYLLPADGAPAPGYEELRAHLQARLPDYMLPAAIMALETWPRTPNGKLDRAALPVPDSARPALAEGYVAPSTPAEQTLAAIWAQVLGLDEVGVHDNFFALGGDSILSIQVVARARQAGLTLTPRQFFQHPTVAGLAAAVGSEAAVRAEQGAVSGPAPLTPIQRWFFAQELPEPHHWNQALLLRVAQPLAQEPLARALATLLAHHDALRLRFHRDATGWAQIGMELPADGTWPELLAWVDLSAVDPSEQAAALTARASDLQAGLDLERGPLLRAAYFDLGPGRGGRLLLVAHHLVVDGVSWRVLLSDLQTAYGQLAAGEEVALPAKTTAFAHWAEQLAAHALAPVTQAERGYWQAALADASAPLPVDRPGGPTSEASARRVRVALGAEETQALLQAVPAAYGARVEDALLTALAQALRAWSGSPGALVALEGHGREELEGVPVDLTRTVGWFTTLYPVRLTVGAPAEPGADLQAVKEQLRQVPRRGIGYGLLRYMDPAGLPGGAQPEVSFNYLGQVDTTLGTAALFGPAEEDMGPVHSPLGQRPFLLDVTGSISGGQLRLEWHYSAARHAEATILGLAERYMEALRALIAHCQTPEAGGYTPSDFPDAELSQAELDDLLEEIG